MSKIKTITLGCRFNFYESEVSKAIIKKLAPKDDVDFASKKAAATASGFTGTLGYAGTAIAGFGTGYLADNYGWNAVFISTIIAAAAAAMFLILTWNSRSQLLTEVNSNNAKN